MVTYKELLEELQPKFKKINDTWYRMSINIPSYKGQALDIYKTGNREYYIVLLDDSEVKSLRKAFSDSSESYRALNRDNPKTSLKAAKEFASVYLKYYEMVDYVTHSTEIENDVERNSMLRKLDQWLIQNK